MRTVALLLAMAVAALAFSLDDEDGERAHEALMQDIMAKGPALMGEEAFAERMAAYHEAVAPFAEHKRARDADRQRHRGGL